MRALLTFTLFVLLVPATAAAQQAPQTQQRTDPTLFDLRTDAQLQITGASVGDELGWSATGAGDVDGDGRPDVLVSARHADPQGRADAGRRSWSPGAIRSARST